MSYALVYDSNNNNTNRESEVKLNCSMWASECSIEEEENWNFARKCKKWRCNGTTMKIELKNTCVILKEK